MKQKLLGICLALILTFGLVTGVSAQSYSFSLDKEVVNAYWNSDGTLALDYQLTFTNSPGGHVIDFVDVGMPNGNYSGTSADVGGNAVSISSDYQGQGSYGFSVDMGAYAIQPGGTGTVHVSVSSVSQVLYPDDNDANYASAVFAPTWFGSQYVNGTTDLSVTFHLPAGVKAEEPRWHASPSGFPSEPQTGIDSQGRVIYTWSNPSASGSTQYTFGASFPKSYVPADAIITTPPFDFSGLISVFISNFGTLLCCGFFAFMFVGVPAFTAISNQRRKMQYLPPKVSIEGHGIKRGLTAVEAAILLEQPLDKVMTMILFGVLKKNAAQVTTRDPLEVKASDPIPTGLQDYENDFLKAFKETAGKDRQKRLQDMVVTLVKLVSEKMRGFSLKETVDYYKAITEKAWAQVEAADTPEVKSQKFDEALEWTMLDKEYDDRTRRVFHGPIYVPTWWGRYDPTYSPATKTSAAPLPVSGQPSSSGRPVLPGADFAAGMVTGVQTFSQKVVGNITAFTEKITGTTNPPPKPSPSSYRGGGGGRSCACACACAGCACACAGGGR
jgi:hypothetical protein